MDPSDIQERSGARKQPIWSGYYFINVGDGIHRTWEDNRKYGFMGAGQGRRYSEALKKLRSDDEIFAYMKGLGYVGYGTVNQKATMIKAFVPTGYEKSLLELDLIASRPDENKDDPDKSEWVVGVKWHKTYQRDQAQTFKGVFANQNIVCKLRHEATVQFLEDTFKGESPNRN